MPKATRAIIFDHKKRNFYSITPLIASIEERSKFINLDVHLSENVDSRIIKSFLHAYDKIVVAFSFRTAQIGEIYERMASLYKNLSLGELTRVIFIAGGSHPTGDPSSCINMGFDFVFIGEGEYSLHLFLKNWLDNVDIYSTPGIVYKESLDERIKINPSPPLINLDEYPFISRTKRLFPPLEISRGCAFGCTFCQVPSLYHGQIRHRSPEVILETVKWMSKRKLDDIRFITPNSFGYMSNHPRKVNEHVILDFLSSIKSVEGIKRIFFGTFPGEVRPETVSENLMKSIKPLVANNRISIGLQSGSETVLKNTRRGHTVLEGLNAINIIQEAGFKAVVDFIFGLPGASEDDELESISVIQKLIKSGATVRPHVFMPLPGTKLEKASYGTTTPQIRSILGKLSADGKIEGNWSNQEQYARESWESLVKVNGLPIIRREDIP